MDAQKQQIIDRIKNATNILVTVSANPSVDQLAACIGLTLMLNKLDKHATAVFSGEVPSTLEFLKPEETLEKNTDSLRDFIISLDKSKADKLRYKVEESIVKIFITPYRTSLSDKDLDFSQGDFNVDVVVALGVHEQKDLDGAITAHGRILHDAVVVAINDTADGNLGTVNWQDATASSLSEMVASMANDFDKDLLDAQVATALLTGVVAQTNRFSNEKTTPRTMSISAELMAAGANQQLVATQLQSPSTPAPAAEETANAADSKDAASTGDAPKPEPGTLEISHNGEPPAAEDSAEADLDLDKLDQAPSSDTPAEEASEPAAPEQANEPAAETPAPETPAEEPKPEGGPAPHLVLHPPTMGGTLTANSQPEGFEPTTDPLSLPAVDVPLLNRDDSSHDIPAEADLDLNQLDNATPAEEPKTDVTPEPAPPETPGVPEPLVPEIKPLAPTPAPALDSTVPTAEPETITPPSDAPATSTESVDDARKLVEDALNSGPATDVQQPIEALGAQHVDLGLPGDAAAPAEAAPPAVEPPVVQPLPPTDITPPPAAPTMPVNDVDPLSSATGVQATEVPPEAAPPAENPPVSQSPADQPMTMPLPPTLSMPPANTTPPTSGNTDNPQGPPAPPVPPPPPMPFVNPNQ